ncbi:MAG: pyrroline-5-carboxylate reductase [Eggerthellaceae bacterium]|nr:pyrroline-5-carboxylate reductase [Eggerthellaceae bacterium]
MTAGRIAFIGCGKMGEAILSGWLASEEPTAAAVRERGFYIVSPDGPHADELKAHYGFPVLAPSAELPQDVCMVLLCVKPQVMPQVLPELAASAPFANGSPLVASIAAGITTESLEAALPADTHVVRVMPNMPLAEGAGASVVCAGTAATDAEAAYVNELFAALGKSWLVEEDQIDAVCALSGGGPAYFAYLAECLAQAGAQAGLSEDLSLALARQTLAGTGACLTEDGLTLEDLRVSVCSPGGTTLAALAAMDEAGFARCAGAGIDAAIARAKELAR